MVQLGPDLLGPKACCGIISKESKFHLGLEWNKKKC